MPDLPLPIDIPWKLINTSTGMMDTGFCDGSRPPEWRPSVAIFAYEPDQDQIPHRCGQRITYLKISVSATGIQAPLQGDEEFDIFSLDPLTRDDFDDRSAEALFNTIHLGRYLACYGVLLNVGVFPDSDDVPVSDYPHIVDFEPKSRELIQAVSLDGEALVASKSQVGTDKSYQKVSGTELGISHTGKYTSPESKTYGKMEASHTISGKWTNTNTETSQVTTELSTEKRERYSAQTSLSQMYNLLSGYHMGTNRATFLMLPRPHVVQPTRFRTFVHGIRQIEGVQEFLLVVTRPETSDGMRVDLTLETGHFPDDVPVPQPVVEYDRDRRRVVVEVHIQGTWGHDRDIPPHPPGTFVRIPDIPVGWEIDPSRGIPGLGGVELAETTVDQHGFDLNAVRTLNYRIEEGRLFGEYHIKVGHWTPDTNLTWHFDVFIRRRRETTGGERPLGRGHFVGTRTQLCTGMSVVDGCVIRVDVERPSESHSGVVNEREVELPEHIINAPEADFTRLAPVFSLNAMKSFLVDTNRRPAKARPGGYAYTQSFAAHLADTAISRPVINKRAVEVPQLSKQFSGLGSMTVRQFVLGDVGTVARKLNVEQAEIVRARVDIALSSMKHRLHRDAVAIDDGIRLTLPDHLLFGFDNADLSSEARQSLGAAAQILGIYPDAPVRIVGHTDSIGSEEHNRKLSERRAQAVVEALVSDYNTDRKRLTAIGRGPDEPVAYNTLPDGSDNPDGRKRNRRVEIEIVTDKILHS